MYSIHRRIATEIYLHRKFEQSGFISRASALETFHTLRNRATHWQTGTREAQPQPVSNCNRAVCFDARFGARAFIRYRLCQCLRGFL